MAHLRGWAGRVPGISREALVATAKVVGTVALFVSHAFHAVH
jgi:hypothetical protein